MDSADKENETRAGGNGSAILEKVAAAGSSEARNLILNIFCTNSLINWSFSNIVHF
jgi:hypothetical protein